MWVIILCVIIYFLFNAVLTLICTEEQETNSTGKAILIMLGVPIVIILAVAIIVEKVRRR